jgi:NADPH2:quinone reductase
MRAMTVTEFGPPDVLTMAEMPDPTPGEQDLLVEVHAAGVNPVDTKIRASGLGVERTFPFIPGYDVSGIVRAMGPKVDPDRFSVGDAVYASPNLVRNGAHAEMVCVDWRTAAHKPESLDHVEAAAMPLVTLTAWESLHTRAAMHTGETVLIQAGAGGVGHIALQLARLHDCRVITTASRDESKQLCAQLGADVIIDYSDEDVVERVRQETDGRGCDVVLDAVGGNVFEQSMSCVTINGRLVSIVYTKTDSIHDKLFRKNVTLHLEFMGIPPIYGIHPESHGHILQTAAELVDAGKLKPHVNRVLPLEQLGEAHEVLQAGHLTGKIVIKVR